MKRFYQWPAVIIAGGLALWIWQWRTNRVLSQRAAELALRLQPAASTAATSPGRTASGQANPPAAGAAQSASDRLKSWQARNAAQLAEMADIGRELKSLHATGNEAGTAPLITRLRELQAQIDATIESNDAARTMLEAFLNRHPSGRDANGEVGIAIEILGHRLMEKQPGALLDMQTPGRTDLGEPAALARVVEMDPAHADSWMRADPVRMTNPDLLKLWLGGLAARDPASALSSLNDVAAIDPRAALEGIPAIASHLRTNEERRQLLTHCAAETDVTRRTALVQAVFGKVSTFAESRELFSGLELPGTAKDQIAAEIATRNIADDPAKRGDWLLEQTTDEGRPEALRQFVFEWTRADYNAAGTWLGQLPVGPTRDTAVADFAGLIRDLDPEAALAWASTVSDPALRQSVLAKIEAGR
jgi:hypothetical protein